MVNDVLTLYDNITKGVRKMIRTFFLVSLLILLGSIIIVLAFSQGWIKILIMPQGNAKEIEGTNSDNNLEQRNDNSIDDYFQDNPLFNIIKHEVEPGETLFDLENLYGTSWQVLKKLNKIKDPIRLQPGLIVRVPIRIADS